MAVLLETGDRKFPLPIPLTTNVRTHVMARSEPKTPVPCPQCGRVRFVGLAYSTQPRCAARACMSCSRVKHKGAEGGRSRLFKIWRCIKWRCGLTSSRHEAHDRYAGRGIEMCGAWAASWWVFRDWALANGYDDGLEIDRVDNDKGYEPSNCRWVTRTENARNRRSAKLRFDLVVQIKQRLTSGELASAIAADFGVSYSMIKQIRREKTWADVPWPTV